MGPGLKLRGMDTLTHGLAGALLARAVAVHGGRDARPHARAARGLGRLRGGDVPGRRRLRVAVLRRVLHHASPRVHPLVRDAAGLGRRPHAARLDPPLAGARPARRGRPADGDATPRPRRRARARLAHPSRLDHVVGHDVPVADLVGALRARLDLHPRRRPVRAPRPRPRRGPRRLETVVPAVENRGARGPPRGDRVRRALRRPPRQAVRLGRELAPLSPDRAAIPQPGSPDRWLLLSDDGSDRDRDVRGSRQAGARDRCGRPKSTSSRARDSAAAP